MQLGAAGNQGQGWRGCQEVDACVLLETSEKPGGKLQACVTSERGGALSRSLLLLRVWGAAVLQVPSSKVLRAVMPNWLHNRGLSQQLGVPRSQKLCRMPSYFSVLLTEAIARIKDCRSDSSSVKAAGIDTDSHTGTQRRTLEQRPAGTANITETSCFDSKSPEVHATNTELEQDTFCI